MLVCAVFGVVGVCVFMCVYEYVWVCCLYLCACVLCCVMLLVCVPCAICM